MARLSSTLRLLVLFGYLVPAHEKTCRYKTGNAGEIPSAGNTFAAGPELL